MSPMLKVDKLSVSFRMPGGNLLAVRDVSFEIERGGALGIVGESGCGKSVTAFSILRLIEKPGEIVSGSILYKGRDIVRMGDDELRRVRGKEIAMIFQEPMTSLNPVFTVGRQISEVLTLHFGMNKKESRGRAVELMGKVGIPSPSKRYDSYPHEFSGGMRQRIMIAMALAGEPSLLIADEPTTALDVTIQAQILDLLMKIQEEREMALILITHDLGVVANTCSKVAVMYSGEMAETADTASIFKAPMHPYTRGLFEAIPQPGRGDERLYTIPGTVPYLMEEPEGCVFAPRCFQASDECLRGRIALEEKTGGHSVRCIKPLV